MTHNTLYLALAITATALLYILRWTFNPQLARIPGPLLARFTPLYRLYLVASGKAPQKFAELHQRYGPVVRIGAQHVSISDPAVVPVVFGTNSKYLKSSFYNPFRFTYRGRPFHTLLTVQAPDEHKALRTPIAGFFSMSSMRFYEPYVDECSELFVSAMQDLKGQTVDLAAWSQWYAFDVIASITFQRRFGFLEQRKDVDSMIADVDEALQALKFLSQMPELDAPVRFLIRLIFKLTGKRDVQVTFCTMCEEEMQRYDLSAKDSRRTDFLSQIRGKEGSLGPNSRHDNMIVHLASNILAGSDTTAIALRATFYYVLRDSRVLAALRKEIDDRYADGQLSDLPTLDETLKMPYLQAVIKEATRVHPSVGFGIQRVVPTGGATLAGYALPGGSIYMEKMRTHIALNDGLRQALISSGRWIVPCLCAGARSCLGKNISIMEIGKLLSRVFRDFDIQFVHPEQEWKLEAAWLWQQKNVPVVFSSRER